LCFAQLARIARQTIGNQHLPDMLPCIQAASWYAEQSAFQSGDSG
jgi:hypothetical protein